MPGILIVDDNATIRGLLRSFVETNTGFEVCGEAENGPDGIQKAKELQPDLVLLDMTMPGMLGTEAAPILKRLLPQVKIILFTLHTDGVNQALASTFDIDIVLSKTDIIANLQEHLIALLAPVDSARKPIDVKDKRIN
jgi:DNA-binding NarL/FixJ family response regulator